MWRVNVEAVTNRRLFRQLGCCVEGECGVPTRANCGRFFGWKGLNLEKEPHVRGGQGFGRNLGFPEEAPQFPYQVAYDLPILLKRLLSNVSCGDIAVVQGHLLLPLRRKTLVGTSIRTLPLTD
jgi:hypothetical protein